MNVDGVLFLQTRLTESLNDRKIDHARDVDGAFRENQSDPVPKTESLSQDIVLGCILDMARSRCGSQTEPVQGGWDLLRSRGLLRSVRVPEKGKPGWALPRTETADETRKDMVPETLEWGCDTLAKPAMGL